MNPQDEPEELTDSSKYMRTYAKDMAALAGQQAGATPVSNAATPPPPPAPTPVVAQTETEDGVTTAQVDESLITQDSMQKGEEVVDLSDTPTSGSVSVFEQKPEPPPPPQPVSVPLGPQSVDPSSREAILARLKQRAGSRIDAPVATPAPEPVAPPPAPEPLPPPPPPRPAPVIPPAPPPPPRPAFSIPTDTVPRMPPVSRPAPVPETAAPFHSYSTDFANRIDNRNASTFSVLAAQADAAPRQVVRSRSVSKPRPKPTVILAAALIVLGLGGLGFGAYVFMNREGNVIVGPGVPSLIAADETKELRGVSGAELMRELRDAADEPLVSGNVLVTYIATASSTPKGVPIRLPEPGGALVKALPLLAPDILIRNVAPESTVGVINAGTETRPFFILKVSSFERTFAGMLAWESDMRSSLQQLYPPYPNAPVVEPTPIDTSATSTIVVPQPYTPPAPTAFVDAIVRSHDVRILRDAGGRSLILYGYKDKETLIIARDEAAFIELVTRLNAAE